MTTLHRVAALGAALAAVLLSACGGGSSSAPPLGPPPAVEMDSAPRAAVEMDSARRASVTVTREAGGTVTATGADGTVYTLDVPPGAVAQDTEIAIVPLVRVDAETFAPLVAGVSAGPSGLRFARPATLRLELPAGFTVPPLGLRAFVADDEGSNRSVQGARVQGRVVTVQVLHFSVIGVTTLTQWDDACDEDRNVPISSTAWLDACAVLRPLFDAEQARLKAGGSGLDEEYERFTDQVWDVLQAWGLALRQRMRAAEQDPVRSEVRGVDDEFFAWRDFWTFWNDEWDSRPPYDRENEAHGVAMGGLIDSLQAGFRDVLIARQERVKTECRADPLGVGQYVREVEFEHYMWWSFAAPITVVDGRNTLPWEQSLCADLVIDAAGPPVLNPGEPALMPIDIRLRYWWGEEVALPHRLSVSVSATKARVSPSGGVGGEWTTPIARNLTVTPDETVSTITISVSLVDFYEPWNGSSDSQVFFLETRKATFQAGGAEAVVHFYQGTASVAGTTVPAGAMVRHSPDRSIVIIGLCMGGGQGGCNPASSSVTPWHFAFARESDGSLRLLGAADPRSPGFDFVPIPPVGDGVPLVDLVQASITGNTLRFQYSTFDTDGQLIPIRFELMRVN